MSQSKLNIAQQYCELNGHRYTKPRQLVLTVLLSEKKPLGAYEVLKKLSELMPNPKPQTVYRALDFWLEHGFVHCIDSLKAYIACCHEHHVGQAQFLICHRCAYVKELTCPINLKPAATEAKKINFQINSTIVEIKGLCQSCIATTLSKKKNEC